MCRFCPAVLKRPHNDGHQSQQHQPGLADPSVFPDHCRRSGVLGHRAGVCLLTGRGRFTHIFEMTDSLETTEHNKMASRAITCGPKLFIHHH